jgi:hypothetical protein
MRVKQTIYSSETRYFNRLTVTAIAVLAVLTATVVKAKLLGEFTWHVGW